MAEHTLEISEEKFENSVMKAKMPVLVEFWAPWCHPCKLMAPIIEDIAKHANNKVQISKVNVEENPTIAERFDITSIPTFILFEEGKVKKTSIGSVDKKRLLETFGKWFI